MGYGNDRRPMFQSIGRYTPREEREAQARKEKAEEEWQRQEL